MRPISFSVTWGFTSMQRTKFLRIVSNWFGEAKSAPVDAAAADKLTGANPGGEHTTSSGLLKINFTGLIENLNPFKRRIVQPRRSRLRRVLRVLAGMVAGPRVLSAEEQAELRERKARQLLRQTLEADATTAMAWMVSCLDRLGICYVRRNSDGEIKRIHHVSFDEVRMEPDALHFHVNMRRLPWGVTVNQLVDDDVTLNNLAAAVGRAVTVSFTPEAGIWYTVERASGRGGIPTHVEIAKLWELMPEHMDPLAFPVGLAGNQRRIYESLSDMPHVLVGGATQSGKTNFLKAIVCTLIRRNPAERVQLVLVDLKGGLAFRRFAPVPHLLKNDIFCPTGIITDREQVLAMLEWLIQSGEQRMGVLSDAGKESIAAYNLRRRKNRMPYLVVVIDELADLMYSDNRKEAEARLVNVVQRMRAVGYHIIVATQVPKSEVITGLIKGNLPCRFAFSVPNQHASQAILDNSSAVRLGVPGRCVMQFKSEFQVQTPFMPDALVDQVIHEAVTGETGPINTAHDVTPLEVLEWALRNNSGWLSRDTLYGAFRERGITIAELSEWLESWEGQEILVNNTMYEVKPAAGSRGRRLVAINDSTKDEEGK